MIADPIKGLETRVIAMLIMPLIATQVSCDFEVVNPGPVADKFLDNSAAFQPIVNGSIRTLSYAVNVAVIQHAIRTRELHVGDVNPWRGVTLEAHRGTAGVESTTYTNPWSNGQAALWSAEDAIRRISEQLEPSVFQGSAVAAAAHLWSGYAHRLLGEYFCQAVFNGGQAMPGEEFLIRAEERFSTGLEIAMAAGASDIATAARAGRASVRINLGDWAGAVEDAGLVPTDFEYVVPFYNDGAWRYYNQMADVPGNSTAWNTFYETYYPAYDDPRVPWRQRPEQPTVTTTVPPWTEIPSLIQQKYTDTGDDVQVSSGEEMRLIEAEALLRAEDMDGAMTIIQELRARVGVDPWPAPASLDEAWALLKKERGIELWLEGRRLADHRRWAENNSPGSLTPWELGGTNGGPDLTDKVLCLPIPEEEVELNSNL